jgi:Domain of unknown function (DUF3387)
MKLPIKAVHRTTVPAGLLVFWLRSSLGCQKQAVPVTADVRRLSAMSPIITILLLLAGASVTIAQLVHPYVRYDFFETRRTDSDHRECLTQIFLTGDNNVGYSYREDVFGATTPTVRSVAFSNEGRGKATPAEQAELVRALLSTNVFDLASEPKPASTDYFSILDVRIDTREARTFFYSPPNSPLRKAVLDVMLQFAKRIKIDRPKDLATERLEAAIARYHSNAITTVQVLEELIQLAKDMRAARERGEEQGLNPEEVAFYDALAENNSAREMMGDEKLRVIAHELVMGLKSSATVDWMHREGERARMRVLVKKILRKYGYPPDCKTAPCKRCFSKRKPCRPNGQGDERHL